VFRPLTTSRLGPLLLGVPLQVADLALPARGHDRLEDGPSGVLLRLLLEGRFDDIGLLAVPSGLDRVGVEAELRPQPTDDQIFVTLLL